ncbi:MAG: hypothetical protein HYX92_17865 [Chloroflexi bacterium]|nr:hypothetical protein [Chloroflexota bacterium]
MSRLDYASAYYKLAVDVRDPTGIFRDTAMTGGGRNYGGFSDKTVDEMIEKQDTTLDAAKRKEIVTQIQERMLELQATAVTHWGSYVSGWWKEVRGFNAEVPPYNNSHYYYVWLAR